MSYKLFKIPKKIYKEFNNVGVSNDLLDKIYKNKVTAFKTLFFSKKANFLNLKLLEKHGAIINNLNIILNYYFTEYKLDYNIIKWILTKKNPSQTLKEEPKLLYKLCQNSSLTAEILELIIIYIYDINCIKFISDNTSDIKKTPLDTILDQEYLLSDIINCLKIMLKYGGIITCKIQSQNKSINYLFFSQRISVSLINYDFRYHLKRYKKIINLFTLKIPKEIIKIIILKMN